MVTETIVRTGLCFAIVTPIALMSENPFEQSDV